MQKATNRKLLSFFIVLILVLGTLSSTVFGTPTINPVNPVRQSDFVETGNGGFISAASKLIQDHWDDNYFSAIIMELDSNTMVIDGEELEINAPIMEDGVVWLPVIDIAEAIDAKAEIDNNTGDIRVSAKGGSAEISVSYVVSSDNVSFKSVSEDGVFVEQYTDGSFRMRSPYVTVNEIEDSLDLKVTIDERSIVITSPYQTKQLIVKTNNGEKLHNLYGASEFVTDNEGMYLLLYPTIDSAKYAGEMLAQEPGVAGVTPNKVYHITALPSPGSWGTPRIGAPQMKEKLISDGKTDEELIVAVIDTGAQLDHPHLSGRLVQGYNAIYGNYDPTDDHDHGTHVSGTIVDCTPDNVKIMPIKVLNAQGNGTDMDIYNGIVYAVDHGAKVLNMSFRGFDDDSGYAPQEDAVRYAVSKGVVCCVASGNDGIDIEAFSVTPARLNEAVTVGGIASNDILYSMSNYGNAIDVVAPAVQILSSVRGSEYREFEGTSMAAPHAAASAAMLLLEDPGLTPDDVKQALRATTVDSGLQGWDRMYGAGIIDFRIHLGEGSVDVTSFTLPAYTYTLRPSLLGGQAAILNPIIGPSSATDKSFTVTSDNESVGIYKDGRVWAIDYGTANLTFTSTSGGISRVFTLTVEESNNWIDFAADEYAGGDGTAENPYQIATPEQMAKVLYEVYVNANTYGRLVDDVIVPGSQSYFELIADIDMGGKMWTPINYFEPEGGGWYLVRQFMGNFDGLGHTISNVEINNVDLSLTGFFGSLMGNTVKNLAIVDADVSPSRYNMIGILTGRAVFSTIENCYTTGTTTGAGFIGDAWGTTIENCFTTAKAKLGGFCTNPVSCYIYNCYASGEVASSNSAGFTNILKYDWGVNEGAVVNSFYAGEAASGIGFAVERHNMPIVKSYYLSENPIGIDGDYSTEPLDLTAKAIGFFQDPDTYMDSENWDSSHPWDFENVWAINPDVNNGLPYLKSLPAPQPNKVIEETGTWLDYAASYYAGGSGSLSDPYLIATPEQLARIAKKYQYGGADQLWFKLIDDIDLAGHDWYPIGVGDDPNTQNWAPVFSGNILGNGKTISNMKISTTGTMSAFISNLQNGSVDNLTLENVNVSGAMFAAGLAGHSTSSVITNCTVTGKVSGVWFAGGLVACNQTSAIIRGCSVDVTMGEFPAGVGYTGDSYIGGLTALNEFGIVETSSAKVNFAGNYGYRVSLVNRNVGGIIRNCYAFDNLSGPNYGLALQNANYGKIEHSYYIGANICYYYETVRNAARVEKTTEEMKDINTYVGWDFDEIWGMDPDMNDGYPYLKPSTSADQSSITTYWKDYAAYSYAAGNGTAAEPYEIETAEQLAKMWVDYSITPPSGKIYYKLLNDIDLSEHLWTTVGHVGSMINNMTIEFEGNGYEIQGMNMYNGYALFGRLMTGSVVKNLGVTGINGTGLAGIVYENYATIKNCYTTGSLSYPVFTFMGGIAAGSFGGSIEECYSDMELICYYGGGLVGFNQAPIKNSYAKGFLMGGATAGIASYQFGQVDNCYYAGEIVGSTGNGLFTLVTGTSSNCYFDEELAYGSMIGKGGNTTAQMKDQSTYANWDFDNIWAIHPMVNNGYPYLISMVTTEAIIEYVTAENGSLEIVFDKVPDEAFELSDFTVTYSVNGGEEIALDITSFSFDDAVYTLGFEPLPQTDYDQEITFAVTFRDVTIKSNTITIDKWTMLEEVEIVYLTPSMVTVTKSKTIQLSVETDPYVDVTQYPYSTTWKSLMPTIVSVNQSGLVTGKAVGMGLVQAIITDPYGAEIVITFSVQVK